MQTSKPEHENVGESMFPGFTADLDAVVPCEDDTDFAAVGNAVLREYRSDLAALRREVEYRGMLTAMAVLETARQDPHAVDPMTIKVISLVFGPEFVRSQLTND